MSPSFGPSDSSDKFEGSSIPRDEAALSEAGLAFEASFIHRTLGSLISHLSPSESFARGSKALITEQAKELTGALEPGEASPSLTAWASGLTTGSKASFKEALRMTIVESCRSIDKFWAERAAVHELAELMAVRHTRWYTRPSIWEMEITSLEKRIHPSHHNSLGMISEYAGHVSAKINEFEPRLRIFFKSGADLVLLDGLETAASHWGLARAAKASGLDRETYRKLFLDLPHHVSVVEKQLDTIRRTRHRPDMDLRRELSPFMANKTHFYQFFKSIRQAQRIESEIDSIFGS